MKLEFKHHGRQFFFVTLALEGRPQVLSRLTENPPGLELTPPGETATAAIRAMHVVFPAVTVSQRAVMPDHIHFLLIINYRLAPELDPVQLCRVFMDAVEEGWRRFPERTGETPAPPDMAALLAAAANRAGIPAGVRGQSPRPFPPPPPPSVQFPPTLPLSPRFDRRCHLELSFDSRQLKAIRRYIRLNPARALWKLRHPDRFLRLPNARHPVLPADRTWQAMGDLTLLSSPFLFHVRLSLRQTPAEHEPGIAAALARAGQGMIPVCGFISPGETELLRRLKASPNARFVKMLPCALPPRYDPSAEDSRELAAGRLLLLSGFPDTPPLAPHLMRRDPAAAHRFRANCLAMNDLAEKLCQAAAERTAIAH